MRIEYIKVDPAEVSKVPAAQLSDADRRILARSGLPGTELYGDHSGKQSSHARVQLVMAMAGAFVRVNYPVSNATNGNH